MMSLISELKRRRVFRVAGMYGITAWVITEVSATVLPALHLPEQWVTIIVVLLITGFPIAMILAWIFDFGPDGLERTESTPEPGQSTRLTSRITLIVAVAAATAILAAFFIWRLGSEDAVARDSIAVLPFVNLAGQADSDYFSDGISEELLNLLANVPGLSVAARTSSFAFKNQDIDIRAIGKQLGVATVLEGSVRWSGDGKQVRITAQLIDAASGYHLWSKTYDRELQDIFVVQDEIARAIVSHLQLQLKSGSESPAMPDMVHPTDNIQAYTLYMQGRALWNQRGKEELNKSIELFQQALALDPGFARAHSNLAAAYVVMPAHENVAQEEYFQKASEEALAALALDETLAESHAVLAHISDRRWQWKDAETSFYFATSLDPTDPTSHHWYSIHLASVGRLEAALKEAEIAAGLDANSGVIQAHLSMLLQDAGRHKEARAAAQRAGALGFAAGTDNLLAEFEFRQGNYQGALTLLEQSTKPHAGLMALLQNVLASVAGSTDVPADRDDGEAFVVAIALNRVDEAYELAQRLADKRLLRWQDLWSPMLEEFRADPRFKQLVSDAGLIEYWRRYGWADAKKMNLQ